MVIVTRNQEILTLLSVQSPIFYLVHNSKLKLVNVGQKEHLDLNTDIYSLLLYLTGLWSNPKRQFLP